MSIEKQKGKGRERYFEVNEREKGKRKDKITKQKVKQKREGKTQ